MSIENIDKKKIDLVTQCLTRNFRDIENLQSNNTSHEEIRNIWEIAAIVEEKLLKDNQFGRLYCRETNLMALSGFLHMAAARIRLIQWSIEKLNDSIERGDIDIDDIRKIKSDVSGFVEDMRMVYDELAR